MCSFSLSYIQHCVLKWRVFTHWKESTHSYANSKLLPLTTKFPAPFSPPFSTHLFNMFRPTAVPTLCRSQRVSTSHIGMKKWESGLLQLWRCPRRPPWTKSGPNPEPLFLCATCNMSCVCRQCARSCHQGHDIRPCTKT